MINKCFEFLWGLDTLCQLQAFYGLFKKEKLSWTCCNCMSSSICILRIPGRCIWRGTWFLVLCLAVSILYGQVWNHMLINVSRNWWVDSIDMCDQQSQECLEKVSETVSFLARPGDSKLLLLTGWHWFSIHSCNIIALYMFGLYLLKEFSDPVISYSYHIIFLGFSL